MPISEENLSNDLNPVLDPEDQVSVGALAQQWAKKYLQSINLDTKQSTNSELLEIFSQTGREKTTQKIRESLRSVSATAWNKTEELLSVEVKQHCIDQQD